MKKTIFLFLLSILLFSCSDSSKYNLGSEKNPIKMFFVPSAEVGRIVSNATELKTFLEKDTGLFFDVEVPMSYAAVIEAMGVNEADIAWLGSFAYVLANEKYNADVALTVMRKGMDSYRGQIVARTDSDIDTIQDLKGKTIAYTDKGSTSGYIYPAGMLKNKGIEVKSTLFAGGHPQAISAVYDGRTDAGCSFWSPEYEGEPQDARQLVAENFSDVYSKIKIIGFTDWIPNDTVVFRNQFDKEDRKKIVDSLLKYVGTDIGKKVLYDLYHIDGFTQSTDATYDVVRKTVESLGIDLEELVND